ncbi:hypothetical protein L13192_07235 [Pyrenophora tritici-repentis]|uniref:Uncharacterized protein n=1 Tax=Pyrenophora tritici-repentis TaxID=45151 RepID=A0A922N6D6_9PLEO|nr:hypothetical protein Ptr86124_012483 [Pyrenophora tritici-repentis]KAI1668099.1 hypothetical protein L13192_07235 [Pyrenophora tritici-repentis]KAI1681186.1 hypothetical protein KJE20_10037 [Pyrenophora tritici-repentis]
MSWLAGSPIFVVISPSRRGAHFTSSIISEAAEASEASYCRHDGWHMANGIGRVSSTSIRLFFPHVMRLTVTSQQGLAFAERCGRGGKDVTNFAAPPSTKHSTSTSTSTSSVPALMGALDRGRDLRAMGGQPVSARVHFRQTVTAIMVAGKEPYSVGSSSERVADCGRCECHGQAN